MAVQQFLSLTDDLICILDEKGHIQEVNSNWKKRLELGPGAESLLDRIEEDTDKKRLLDFFNQEGPGIIHISSCRLKDINGESYWIDLKIRRNVQGNKYWCLIRDISAKKYVLKALDQVSDLCNIGHWEYHSHNEKLVWSSKVFEILKRDPLQGPTIQDFRNYFSVEDMHRLDLVQAPTFEFTLKVDIEGEIKWVHLKGRKEVYPDGTFHLQGILQDRTVEVWKEETRLSNNIELSSFEKGLDQFTIVARTDERGRIIQANEEFCRISKYSEEQLIGKDHRILNSGYHPPQFFAEMWDSIKEGKNWRGEIKNKAKDGSFYWVDTIIIPIRDRKERLKEILSFRFEITRLKKEEEEGEVLRNQINLLTNLTIPLWSYDFQRKKLEWNASMHELFKGIKPPHFEGFLQLLEIEDQAFLKACFNESRNTDFQKVMKVDGQEVLLHFKVIRDNLGEVLRIDGVFHREIKELKGIKEAYFVA